MRDTFVDKLGIVILGVCALVLLGLVVAMIVALADPPKTVTAQTCGVCVCEQKERP